MSLHQRYQNALCSIPQFYILGFLSSAIPKYTILHSTIGFLASTIPKYTTLHSTTLYIRFEWLTITGGGGGDHDIWMVHLPEGSPGEQGSRVIVGAGLGQGSQLGDVKSTRPHARHAHCSNVTFWPHTGIQHWITTGAR